MPLTNDEISEILLPLMPLKDPYVFARAVETAVRRGRGSDAEPVAWRVRRLDAPDYWIVFLHLPVDALKDPEREVQALYVGSS